MSTRGLEISIAWRYLRSRRGSRLLSFITVIAMGGVIVGVSALVVIMGVMNGLQTDLREKILVASPDIRVLNFGEDLRISDWRAIQARVAGQRGVVAAAPFVLGEALANVPGRKYAGGVQVMGIMPSGGKGPDVTPIRSKAITGDFRFATRDGKRRGIVLGRLLADRFSATIGTPIRLAVAAGQEVSSITGSIIPRISEFEVTGIFETGMYEYDNQYVVMDLEAAQALVGLGDAVTGIEVRTTDRWAAPALALTLSDTLGFPYRTIDWQQQNSALFRALKLEKLGMAVILALITLVAAFNIVSTLTMVVRDKQREIGILKAMGLTAGAVRRIFLTQGIVIGVVGTGIGLAIGLGTGVALDQYHLIVLDPQIYFIDHLPVRTELLDILLIALASLAVATLATVYPAAQAARLYPVEAIRSE
jgi:lipoprotein-releasing system permease protein